MKEKFIPIVIGALGTVTEGLIKGLVDLKITEWVETISNYCIVEICQNIEKSPGDFRRLAVTQTPVKDHQLMLMWKSLNESIIIIQLVNLLESRNKSSPWWYCCLYLEKSKGDSLELHRHLCFIDNLIRENQRYSELSQIQQNSYHVSNWTENCSFGV